MVGTETRWHSFLRVQTNLEYVAVGPWEDWGRIARASNLYQSIWDMKTRVDSSNESPLSQCFHELRKSTNYGYIRQGEWLSVICLSVWFLFSGLLKQNVECGIIYIATKVIKFGSSEGWVRVSNFPCTLTTIWGERSISQPWYRHTILRTLWLGYEESQFHSIPQPE